jgi:hypothetical protein
MPNILGLLSEMIDIRKSMIEIRTRPPSMIFQPDVK